MLGKTWEWVPQTTIRRNFLISVNKQTVFELHPTHSFNLSSLGDTKRLQFIKLELKIKRPFLNAFLISVRPFLTGHGTLNICENPWADISSGLFIQLENIFNIYFELWLDNNRNPTFMILGVCTIKVLCHLQVKYYLLMIFIVQCNLPIKFQYHSFLELCLCGLFICMWNLTVEACPSILDTRSIRTTARNAETKLCAARSSKGKSNGVKFDCWPGFVSAFLCLCECDLLLHEKHNAHCEVKRLDSIWM